MTGLPFLVISIGIHILTIFVLQKTSLLFSQPAKDPVEITVVEKNNRKLISTHSPKNPNTLNLRPQNPRFQGETDQVVKEETKAPNLNYLNAKSSSAQSGIKQNENKNEESENDPTAERLHHLGETLFTQVASDTSTLDFIKEGSVTSLNTERNVY